MSGRDEQRGRREEEQADEPFLSRWSRLKQASREEAPPAPTASADDAAAQSLAEARAAAEPAGHGEDGAPVDEPPELPPLESLTEESDFSAFMQATVDPALRRMALRKMWSNPKYALVDPLDPFRADFAAFTPLGDIVTSDMKFHAERLLRKELEKAAEAAEAAAAESAAGEQADDVAVRGDDASAGAAAAGTDAAGEPGDEQDDKKEGGDERRDA